MIVSLKNQPCTNLITHIVSATKWDMKKIIASALFLTEAAVVMEATASEIRGLKPEDLDVFSDEVRFAGSKRYRLIGNCAKMLGRIIRSENITSPMDPNETANFCIEMLAGFLRIPTGGDDGGGGEAVPIPCKKAA